ncbi:uncharacterized membrane protein YjjB (DUF3815 family) [Scopulibacillus darangshiensis]|uniref:Uncharacterized membrane protein YjjB (DUF3815 family) n=1 Tax=Scopulibacillus darangshiensis TaxID=442528 RepID=A0A4R2P2M4_9BACL|nr:threonine/serine exporter family protein [Scopulibacillus darangshiensis]TCP28979.1 uncharacterized membrane protein YjjB (DUF3815 family) [Scopulibacillus darangshiensis]
MVLLEQAVTSFIASAAFGVLFNVPRRSLLPCGFVGMLGWLVYFELNNVEFDSVVATLVAAFVIAAISHMFAKRYKLPIIIFSVAGIIPLVPGGLAFNAMKHFVQNDYNAALEMAAKAFMISGAIAVGLVLSEVINHVLRNMKKV